MLKIKIVCIFTLLFIGIVFIVSYCGTDSDTQSDFIDSVRYMETESYGRDGIPYIDSIRISLSNETIRCEGCHLTNGRGTVMQWRSSKHYSASVGCYECHKANSEDTDAYEHYGAIISTIVSPQDCAACHEEQVSQFTGSHHAKGGEILGSLDNVLAERVEGYKMFNGESPVAVTGCGYCHGSQIKVNENGKLDPSTWPNSGIGRLNPDGSKGSCSACHTRHIFSIAQARRPENCGRCHIGPDHPQLEVYNESQHGILFHAFSDELNLSANPWIAGQTYSATPTCATCHMSATQSLGTTHDAGDRLSWNLRAPVSSHIDRPGATWQERRQDMQSVCKSCHSDEIIINFYAQIDAGVELYNEKFALPAKRIHDELRSSGIVDSSENFDDEMEWLYWYLWHHEGRRARVGLAMNGPDYIQWHGFYDIAERFYMELVPEAKTLCEDALDDPQKAGDAARILGILDEIMNSEMHEWFAAWE